MVVLLLFLFEKNGVGKLFVEVFSVTFSMLESNSTLNVRVIVLLVVVMEISFWLLL